MKIAQLLMRHQSHDNLTLDRLVKGSKYQNFPPVKVITNMTFIFEDGSALIHTTPNEWRAISNYRKNDK